MEMDKIMASYSVTEIRECEKCGHIHDCAWFVEMQVLCDKLDKKINELVKYVDACDKAGLSTPSDYEKHPLEDK